MHTVADLLLVTDFPDTRENVIVKLGTDTDEPDAVDLIVRQCHGPGPLLPSSPVLVRIPGSYGWHARSPFLHDTPKYACTNVILWSFGTRGKNKFPWNRNFPDGLVTALTTIRRLAARTKRPVLLVGFSRGGKWVQQLACTHASLFDGALVLAGYPSDESEVVQRSEASALVNVTIPVDILQFNRDLWSAMYPVFTSKLQHAMKIRREGQSRSLNHLLVVLDVDGDHDDAERVFANTCDTAYTRLWSVHGVYTA